MKVSVQLRVDYEILETAQQRMSVSVGEQVNGRGRLTDSVAN